MSRYSLIRLSDDALLRDLTVLVGKDRSTTAELLAHIAEVDARKAYVPAAYPTMFAYCVGKLHLSEDAAAKRIHAARAARRFPAVFDAVAEGRLHLSAVVLLAPHLTEDNAADLLAAAVHKSKSETERLLAERFPRPDVLAWVTPIPPHAPGHADAQAVPGPPEAPSPLMSSHAPGHVNRSRVKPMSAESFDVQFTMGKGAHDKLQYAQELLSHQVPSGDIAAVFERALDALIPRLEKARFAAASRPRSSQPLATANSRHIPALVMQAVWERDGGQCTFVSESGHRCQERRFIQFDHILEVARGGGATADNLRLRCRAHNQFEAERTYGAEFMRHKRIAAADARVTKRSRKATPAHVDEVVPWLRQLGFRDGEARKAAARCEDMAAASLEDRVRAALTSFRVRGIRVVPAGVAAAAG